MKAPDAIWFMFNVFLFLERWPVKVVKFPLPGPGMAIWHLLHPADAISYPLNLAAVVSCWCCQLEDISVLPPRQLGLICPEVFGCGHLHLDNFENDLIRNYSCWDFSFSHPPVSLLGHTISPCRFSVWALESQVTPGSTRKHCIWLAVDRLCTDRERLMHSACPFLMLQAAMLASGEGWEPEMISNLTLTNTVGASYSHLAGISQNQTCTG